MALVTLTELYSNLTISPAYLLSASDGVVITAQTATDFSWTFAAGTRFAGYSVTATGTGFAYDGTTPVDGTMSGLQITDANGQAVLTVSAIAAGSLASDLALFASYEFGWTTPDGTYGAQTSNAWSQLFSGADTINGTSGDDHWGLIGAGGGADVYNMMAGNDFIAGGLGNDTIFGGDGWDTLSYANTILDAGIGKVQGIIVNMTAGTVSDPYGATDTFSGIEEIHGSVARDIFYGGATPATFEGLRGSDTFVGGASGQDRVAYTDDRWNGGTHGIVATLGVSTTSVNTHGTVVDGFGNVDHTTNIQNVAGTIFGDTFTGSALNNIFAGGEGTDRYDGGNGEDVLSFYQHFSTVAQHGVSVDLRLATGQVVDDGFGNTENATSIEDILGSPQADRITGSTGNNVITGAEGADTMTGGGGHDTFVWRNLSELGAHDVINDFHAGIGVARDYLSFDVSNWGGSSTLHFVTGTAATSADATFLFNPATHLLSWDPDGTGAQAALAVVTLNHINTLLASDFILV